MTKIWKQDAALWRLGFRPMYLLAAFWLALSVPVWLLMLRSPIGWHSHLNAATWHAHEMIFGFSCAVIVGFLFTAVRNWTGVATPSGRDLQLIALSWLMARILFLTPYSAIGIGFELLFFLLAVIGIARCLLASNNRRNYLFIGLLSVLGLLALAHHLSALKVLPISATALSYSALSTVALIISVMAGRVIPMFTQNAIANARVRRFAWLEFASIGGLALAILLQMLLATKYANGLLMLVATIHLCRWWLWDPLSTWRRPILWILHLSYLCLPIAMFLYALPPTWLINNVSLAVHTFTVGSICGLCIGMMTRTARGHTGRALQAGTLEIIAYVLVLSAVVVRVLLSILFPAEYMRWIEISGGLLILAFALYFIRFLPWLVQARADGKPG